MADYRLNGKHSLSLDRARGGKYGTVTVRCDLVVYRLQFLGITDAVLRKELAVPFLQEIAINNIHRGHEWAGAVRWSFQLVFTIDDEHVRTTTRLGRRRSEEELRHAPWTALSRLERALRYAWAAEIGSSNLSNERYKSLTMQE